jgi:hypothetical protein
LPFRAIFKAALISALFIMGAGKPHPLVGGDESDLTIKYQQILSKHEGDDKVLVENIYSAESFQV